MNEIQPGEFFAITLDDVGGCEPCAPGYALSLESAQAQCADLLAEHPPGVCCVATDIATRQPVCSWRLTPGGTLEQVPF
jgi:hypothetical protein